MPETPQPIVILGTGRSFTSVVCCMIGQHPELLGVPETNIFRDPTLGQVYERFGRRLGILRRSGLLRTLAQLHDGEQTEGTIDAAADWVIEHAHWSSGEVAAYLARLAAPRGIVEKSVSTCRDAATLARCRQAWPDAFYLHITRHPESVVSSMQSRIDGALEKGKGQMLRKFMEDNSLDDYYARFTSTILSFMATLPPGRGMNLHGERFLTDARPYARQICEWVGIDASEASVEAMMHPENNPFARPGPPNAPAGMSSTFLNNPTYSGKPVPVKPMTIDASDPGISKDSRAMALLGHRLGYA